MNRTSRIPLLIVGGGIGGLATALAVSRTGRPAHVLEKSPEFAELGAGLQLAPNAMRMLDRLGILDEILKLAIFPRQLIMMDAVSEKPVTILDLGRKFVEHYGYPYIVMHRGDLLGVELAACRANKLITLESSKEVLSVEDLGDGARVRCADGSVYDCDALVGADGLWSTTRKLIYDDGDPICSQFVAYRGTLPIADAPDGADFDNMTIWVGPDLHFVQYVVKSGELFNQVAVFRSDRYKPNSEDWGTVDELNERFRNMCPRVCAAVAKIGRNRRWPMFDRLPIPNWTRNHITLLGDAAHPMLQYLAQGACQALEDAVCLGDTIQASRGSVAGAFSAYQQSRIARTARVQTTARFFGDILHAQGVAVALRNALLGQRTADDFGYFEWLYGYKGASDEELSRYASARS